MFGPLTKLDIANVAVFAFTSLLMVWLAVAFRNLLKDYDNKERDRLFFRSQDFEVI
jgi:hypothetical protein